jgi:Tfp pilus assembly protein PilZ
MKNFYQFIGVHFTILNVTHLLRIDSKIKNFVAIAVKICNYRNNHCFNSFRNENLFDSSNRAVDVINEDNAFLSVMLNSENQGILDSGVKDIRDPRKYPRVPYIGPVVFKCGNQKYNKGWIVNISRSGVFIETKKQCFFGQAIELVIPYKKIDKRIRIRGWIVRLGQAGIGVTFKKTLERRSGKERRSDLDRRRGLDRRNSRKHRAGA